MKQNSNTGGTMQVTITITPFAENADAGDDTGLTQAAYEKLTTFLADFAEEYDINIERDTFGAAALESRIAESAYAPNDDPSSLGILG